MPTQLLGPDQAPFVQMIAHSDKLGRKGTKPVHLRQGRARRARAASGPMQFGKRPPARLERGIELYRPPECLDRRRIVAGRAGKVPGFLPRAPIFRHRRMQTSEIGGCILMPFEITARDSGEVKRLAIVGICVQQCHRVLQTPVEITALHGAFGAGQPVFTRRHGTIGSIEKGGGQGIPERPARRLVIKSEHQ